MYHIKRIVNGNANKLHIGIKDYNTAYDILECISVVTGTKRYLRKWGLTTDSGRIIYQIDTE